MLILVTYDVVDDRRRTRLADTLADFGSRVQYSVFECRLEEPQVERMRARVLREIDPEADSVRLYRLCGPCTARLEAHGVDKAPGEPDVYIF